MDTTEEANPRQRNGSRWVHGLLTAFALVLVTVGLLTHGEPPATISGDAADIRAYCEQAARVKMQASAEARFGPAASSALKVDEFTWRWLGWVDVPGRTGKIVRSMVSCKVTREEPWVADVDVSIFPQ